METVSAHSLEDDAPQLWEAFTAACSEEDYYQSWLGLQSGWIDGSVQALLVLAAPGGQLSPVAGWPQQGNDPVRLSDVIERVVEEQCGLLVELPERHYGMAYPLLIEDALHAVVAVELTVHDEAQLQQAMEQLQWGTAWLELLVRRRQAEEDQATLFRLKTAVDLLAETLGKEQFDEAAIAFTTELAAASGCERVSLGFMRGGHIKLESVSHSAEVGKKMNLTRAIEKVMEEAVLQRCEVTYPAQDGEVLICREHEALSRQQAMASIATFPLFCRDQYVGALTCERAADQPFTQRDMEFMRSVSSLVAPAMEEKYRLDRPVPVVLWQALCYQLEALFGAGHVGRKLFATIVLGVVIFFTTATGDYRLTADTSLEGAIRRAIVVPFDGYIDQAPGRAGDLVEQGQLLCSLDSRDLHLQKLAKVSQHRQMEQQYQDAVANHDRSQAVIIRAQLEQSQAEMDLLDARLARTSLTAPFSGLVVSGDLSQRLGGAVEQGEVLFEVTPLDAYRVILKVDERRIGDVAVGQHGTLVLSSLPDNRYPFAVDKITPITKAEDGRNYFRVEAHLQQIDDSLRPGMEGVGKIDIDRRKLIAIWARDFVEWLQLTLWTWTS